MGNPKVSIVLSQSNLGLLPADASGVMGLIAAIPAANASGYGVPVVIKSKAQAIAELNNTLNAGILAAIVNGFFGEVSEGAPLYCVFVANTTSLSAMADSSNSYVANLVNASTKTIRAIAIVKYPAGSYTPTITAGFDEDVDAAVTKATAQAAIALSAYKPIEFIIQGYGFTNATDAKDYSTTTNPNVHVVVASEDGDSVIPVLRAIGRKASDRPSRNIGRVQGGSLNIADGVAIALGATALATMLPADLDTLHDKRYITYIVNENAPGYIFNDDVSLVIATSDYSNWANNAVIGEAVRTAYATYYKTLKDDVDVDQTTGRIGVAVEKNLEQDIIDAINTALSSSISGVDAKVNPDIVKYAALYANADITNPNLNLTASGKIYVFLTIVPKGYIKNVTVALGFGLTA